MIYGQDAPIAFPVADLYDSGMMQMYVQAARDLYQQGLRDYENFVAKYGDFSSPFKNDVDAWNNEIMGPTVNMIEAMYAQGIDPTRNAEARAMISRAMRTIPYEKAAIMRQNAKAGEEYLKARGALAAKGLYDKDYNDFWLREQGYTPFEEWDSSKGVWNITSPVEYKSLFDATNPWFKNLKPHELTKQQVIDAKHPYDPNYIYTGIPIDDLRAVTAAGIPGFMNSIEGRYYRDYVSKRLAALGIEPTEEAVNAALAEDIVTANHLMTLAPSREADRFAIMDRQAQLNEQQAQRDFNRDIEKLSYQYRNDPSKNGQSTGTKSSGGADSLILSEWDEGLAHNLRVAGYDISNTDDLYTHAFNVRDSQERVVGDIIKNNKNYSSAVNNILNTYSWEGSPGSLSAYLQRSQTGTNKTLNRVNYVKGDYQQAVTGRWIVDNMVGNYKKGHAYIPSEIKTIDNVYNKENIPEKDIESIEAVNGKNRINVSLKDGSIHLFMAVRFVYVSERVPEKDKDGNENKDAGAPLKRSKSKEYYIPVGPVSDIGQYSISPENRYKHQVSDALMVKQVGGGMKGAGTSTDYYNNTNIGTTNGGVFNNSAPYYNNTIEDIVNNNQRNTIIGENSDFLGRETRKRIFGN